jgi:hypothetical protein
MALAGFPQLGVSIDFTNGAQFITTAFTLDNATKGVLGTGQLADADDRVDVSDITLQVSIRRGRNRILDKFEAGTATVILQDDQGYFNPSNTSSPYYGQLIPLRKIQIYADFNGTRYPLFYGFIQQYTTNFAVGVDDVNKVTLQCVDGFRLLNNVAFTTVTGAVAGDLSGTRVGQLLDTASWPAAARSIDTGSSTLQTDPGTANRNMLDAIQLVADKSENGGFFIDSAGNAVFYSRDTMAKKSGATPVVFTDTGTGIDYQGVEVFHDDTLILNDVTVQRLGGSAQRVQDTTSQNTYFVHSGVRTDILVQTDDEALAQAQMALATRKDAEVRISSLMLNLFDSSAPTRVTAGLDADIFDVISVSKTMSGDSTLTKTLLVQGVQYDITKKSFVAKLLTNEPTISGFQLDSTVTGVLDSSAGLLSY